MTDHINTLKKTREYYKKYSSHQGLQSPSASHNPQQQVDNNTEIIMLPYPQQIRSKTADGTRVLAYRTIGEEGIMKEKLLQRNAYSRQNLQTMHKKLREIRSNRYNEGKETRDQQNLGSNNFKLMGKSKILSMLRQENKNPIVYKSSSAHFKSRKQIKNSFKNSKDKLKQSSFRQRSNMKIKKGLNQIPAVNVMPNQFKTKIKVKCVEDNPKYLATLIRKKVQFMNREEVYDYIQKLVHKSTSKLN